MDGFQRLNKIGFVAFLLLLAPFAAPEAQAVAPTVQLVSSTVADGIYGYGDIIPITIKFDQVVTVTGTPTLVLQISPSATANVSYTSGTGTDTLQFNYTVGQAAGTSGLSYASTSSLSGTIKNSSLESAILTLPSPGSPGSLNATKNIVIEYFGSYVSGVTTTDGNHLFNLVYSSSRGKVLSILGTKIIELSPAVDTRTVILEAGSTPYSLQIFGSNMYWRSASGVYFSDVSNPSKQTLFTHTLAIRGFTRTTDSWVFIDSGLNLYKVSIDGQLTKTLIATLSASVIDASGKMYSSPNSGKFLWTQNSTGKVYEVDASTGSSTIYADTSKCTTSIRGYLRLNDGSEIFPAYSPVNFLTRRWPDGRITCSATSYSPWMFGDAATDGTYLYVTVYGSSSSDYRFGRFTPMYSAWGGFNSYDPAAVPTSSSISNPSLLGGGTIVVKGVSTTITVSVSVEGRVTFKANGKNIGGCIKLATTSLSASCTFKPSVQGSLYVVAYLTPSSNSYSSSASARQNFVVARRTTTR